MCYKEIKRSSIDTLGAKSEQRELEVSKIKEDLPLSKYEQQPRCPVGLSNWQKKKLQRLSEQELKEKNMT